jgi:hypothetical protein
MCEGLGGAFCVDDHWIILLIFARFIMDQQLRETHLCNKGAKVETYEE